MIAALAIEDGDGNIAPAVYVAPDGSVSPIATNADGTAPCCCDPSVGIVCADLTRLPGVCFNLNFQGIGVNPASFSAFGTTYLTDTLVGANRSVAMHSLSPVGLFFEADGLVLLSWTGTPIPESNPFVQGEIVTFFMAVDCVDDQIRIRQVDVGLDNVGSGASIFSWQGAEPLVNGMVLVNQILGQDDPLGAMRFGQGGSVTISASLTPIGQCVPGAPPSHLAFKCDNPAVRIPVDISTRPPGFFGVRYQGENYRLSGQTSDLPPVPVEWTSSVCPPPPTGFAIAEKCRPAFPIGPATVVYAVDPAVGLGQGAVRLIEQYPNPECPGRTCTAIIQYRPTAAPAAGPATPNTAHLNGTACALSDQVTCQACPGEPNPNDPITRPRSTGLVSEDQLDAEGLTVDIARQQARQPGCCGPPQ